MIFPYNTVHFSNIIATFQRSDNIANVAHVTVSFYAVWEHTEKHIIEILITCFTSISKFHPQIYRKFIQAPNLFQYILNSSKFQLKLLHKNKLDLLI